MVTLIVANSGSGTGAQLGAARLLYGMGRSGALPPKFFAYVDPRRRVPRNNVLLVGLAALFGAFVLEGAARAGYTGGYELGAQLLNFGALIAFMGVNLAAFVRYFIRQGKRTVGNLVPPLMGFAICLLLWLNLSPAAKKWGALVACAGPGLRRLEDPGLPQQPGQLRLPQRRRQHRHRQGTTVALISADAIPPGEAAAVSSPW